MTCCQTPPTRKSISSIVVVKPRGPHQFTTCFGLVIASQTSSRGALKSRVMTISRSAVSLGGLFFDVMIFLFNVCQKFSQLLQTLCHARFKPADVFVRLVGRLG